MSITRKLKLVVVLLLVATAYQALLAAPRHAKPSAPAPVPNGPITISITSSIRHGNLVLFLDGKPVFNEEFQRPLLLFVQTTTWDPPLQVPAGKHQFSAKVYGKEGKTYLSGTYALDVSPTKGIGLRVRVKGDKLTVEPAS